MQRTRTLVQASFLALTLIGVFVVQGNAERWCPLGGLETVETYLSEGNMVCSLGVSNLYALGGLLLAVLLVRRAFCSHICPIGTLTEWVGRARVSLGSAPRPFPDALDRGLSLLKYGILLLILWVTWRADELLFRTADPCYALLSRHGEDITTWAYLVSAAVLAGAFFTPLPFCRWLCPLAAVMNPFSRLGLLRVRRDEGACRSCRRCLTVCPMQIPIPAMRDITSARCTACLKCVTACPSKAAGGLGWGLPRRLGGRWPAWLLTGILLVATGAVVAASLALPLPAFSQSRGQRPEATSTLDLNIQGVSCRGTSNLLTWFLFRSDILEIDGYLKVETWPGGGHARVRITYDPELTGPGPIKEALVTPCFDRLQGFHRDSPFRIEGYAPWEEDLPRPR